MTTGLDIRALLELIASYDGREIGLAAISAWTQMAMECAWNKRDAFDAVLDYYAQDPQPCWANTGEPRPVLPGDINEHHERQRRGHYSRIG